MTYEIPILYIPFKRLNVIEVAFGQIKKIKPKKLYIAQDGARNEEEAIELKDALDYIKTNIDWDCNVYYLKSEKNVGPNLFIFKTISWFFENEEYGVIIEEDGYASDSFFEFAKELLIKHKEDKNIWAISGFSAFSKNNAKYDYYISNFNFAPWAFATWKDRWDKFDFSLKSIKSYEFLNKVYEGPMLKIMRAYSNIIENNIEKFKDKVTWDLRFRFNMQYNNGYCIFPRQNIIKHLDFDSQNATSFHQDTFLKDISEYIDISEFNFKNFSQPLYINDKTLSDRFLSFWQKDVVFSITSQKVIKQIKDIIKNYDKVYIYGAGFFAYIFYSVFKDILEDKHVAFVDDNQNQNFLGKSVLPPYEIKNQKNSCILIAITKTKDIKNILEKLKSQNNVIILRKLLEESL